MEDLEGVDYSQGKVYSIHLPGLEEICYVGSTVIPLWKRLAVHKTNAKSNAQYKFASCVLFGEDNDPIITLLEAFPCITKQELLEREKYWQDKFPDRVNKNPAILTEEQRKTRHKEIHLIAYNKNKEHNLAKHKAWIDAHKDEQAEYKRLKREADLTAARAADKLSNQNRDKEKRNAWKSAKVSCDVCKLVLSRNNFPTHKKNKHPDMDVGYTLCLGDL